MTDITEARRNLIALNELLKEKDLLLRELQHRVKNSFSIVVSLISLELTRNKDINKETLENLKKRIYSISSLYDLLYYSGSVNRISMEKYFSKIIEHVKISFISSQEKEINFSFESDEVELELKKAISLGLILNELLINAIKHSFTEKTGGNIEIKLKKEKDTLKLIVSDDGQSFPENIHEKGGFGFHLINLLVNEINGELKIKNTKDYKLVEIRVTLS